MPNRGQDVKAAISLLLSVLSSLISLAGIAYAAGTLTNRVTNVEQRVSRTENVPERLATIEAKINFLVEAENDRKKK